MTIAQTIVDFLLEDEDDPDPDWKDVVIFQSAEDVDEWMKNNLPRIGFTYRSVGIRGWEKEVGNRMVTVKPSYENPGQALINRYQATRTSLVQDESALVDCGIPILLKLLDWRMVQ